MSASTRLGGPRRYLSILAAVSVLIGVLSGCSLSAGSNDSGDTLTLAVWKDYGSDLPWVAQDFKKKTGATLKFQYIDSEANLLKMMAEGNGSIDVGLPNIQHVGFGIEDGTFAPLDESRLENLKDIFPRFANLKEIRKGGSLYSVPWTWGSTGLFYVTPQSTPTSIAALWDPANKGKTAILDDATVTVPTAALYLGEDPQNPDMSKITPALVALKNNAKMVYSSVDDLAKAVSTNTVSLGIANGDTVGGIGAEHPTLKYTIPSQGAVGWIDTWAISAKSKKKDLAYKWINYMTSKEFLTKWANTPADASPAPANEAVVKSLPAATLDRLQVNLDIIDRLALQLPVPQSRLQAWDKAWQTAKAS
ncbi:MAG: extracellular solute-binding protein [Gordonia sp. (in: high G+C Gram-positive bacteria)]